MGTSTRTRAAAAHLLPLAPAIIMSYEHFWMRFLSALLLLLVRAQDPVLWLAVTTQHKHAHLMFSYFIYMPRKTCLVLQIARGSRLGLETFGFVKNSRLLCFFTPCQFYQKKFSMWVIKIQLTYKIVQQQPPSSVFSELLCLLPVVSPLAPPLIGRSSGWSSFVSYMAVAL